MGMAGGPVRLPLDDLDEKKTDQLRKVLATIPKGTAGVRTAPMKSAKKKAAQKPASQRRAR
jgi:4-hydroxy-tetrahydrodipicolinate synthase